MSAARSTVPGSVPGALDAVPGVLPGDLPFERALEQLEEIVRRLEKGDVPLDESVTIYERGEALKRHCEALLRGAEARIRKITIGPDGQAASAAPLDVA